MKIAYKTGLATSAVVRFFTNATTGVISDYSRGVRDGAVKAQPLPVENIDEQIKEELSSSEHEVKNPRKTTGNNNFKILNFFISFYLD